MSFSIKIIDVKALDNFILHVCFNNGIKKSYDVMFHPVLMIYIIS